MSNEEGGTERSNVRVKGKDVWLSGDLSDQVEQADGSPSEIVNEAVREYIE